MRLTLRTLLAYLDNTLDPKDAEAIRDKLGESGFATQLVQRIRGTLDNPKLSAPPPNAVNPVAEANVISEYLDSTLSVEQVAEIEKACLESDTHLAEAAACHQILTMVLGQPADVPATLRERIYAIPEQAAKDIPATAAGPSGSFSSVAVPETDTLTGMPEEPAESVLTPSAEKVEPVGVADSGNIRNMYEILSNSNLILFNIVISLFLRCQPCQTFSCSVALGKNSTNSASVARRSSGKHCTFHNDFVTLKILI